jgi:hypothetical protein
MSNNLAGLSYQPKRFADSEQQVNEGLILDCLKCFWADVVYTGELANDGMG